MKNNYSKFITVVLTLIVMTISLVSNPSPTVAQEPDRSIPSTQSELVFTSFVYLPIVNVPAVASLDLSIEWMEFNQGIQNLNNNVNLVTNRPAVVRVYLRTDQNQPISNVKVNLTAYRNGIMLPNSPLSSDPGTAWPMTTSLDSIRADESKSVNFKNVPQEWLNGSVTLTATVDPDNEFVETSEGNNSYQQVLQFVNVPPLDIKVVPIRYTHLPTGAIFPPASSAFVEEALFKLYPVSQVNVSLHTPYDFTGNLKNSSSWSSLLDQITSLKNTEGAPTSQVYYGLVPLTDQNGQTWWPGSGIAGIGWIGFRASVGLTQSQNPFILGGEILAHELGHNFGREHSPCGNPDGVDPNFPYPGGVIGQVGFEIHNLPQGQIVPSNTPDIMSYCDYAWVSDYTYQGLFDDQVSMMSSIKSQASQSSLYIRLRKDSQGNWNFLPTYNIISTPQFSKTNNDYKLQLLDELGKVISEYPVQLLQAVEPGISTEAIELVIPEPNHKVQEIRLLQGSKVLAKEEFPKYVNSPRRPVEFQAQGTTGILQWGNENIPALVRYSLDDGKTWETIGFDILQGRISIKLTDFPQGKILFEIILGNNLNQTFTYEWIN